MKIQNKNIKKLSKNQVQQKIIQLSNNLSKDNIIKIKKLAMSKNIKLGQFKKKFCKNCLATFNLNNSKIRIKKGFKLVKCNCGYISRYKLK